MPKIQIALDMADIGLAFEVAGKVAGHVDVIEAGTLLCASEGLKAATKLKKNHPDKEVLADLRIVRAGGALADLAFQAGADIVTCVAEAPDETIAAAAKKADEHGGKIELELQEDWDIDNLEFWKKCGITDVICHLGAEVSSIDGESWGETACKKVEEVAGTGINVAVAGGITQETASKLSALPISKVICGKAIWKANDPEKAASDFALAFSSHQ